MNEPPCNTDARTTATNISRVNQCQHNLYHLLKKVYENHHRDPRIETISNSESQYKGENY